MADARTLILRVQAETELARAEIKKLEAETAVLERQTARDLDAVATYHERAGRRIEAEAKRLKSSTALSSFSGGFLGGAVSGLVSSLPSLLVRATEDAVQFAGSIQDVSDKLGVSTGFLQDYRYGATQAGASTEQADQALTRFEQVVGKAADGNKKAAASFKALGVDIADQNGNLKPVEQLYRETADAIAKLPDPARQAAAAIDLFGVTGAKILPLLKSGSAGLDEMGRAAEALGLKLSADTIARLDDLGDKAQAIKTVITAQLAAAIGENADAIIALGNGAAGAIGQVAGFLRQMQGIAFLLGKGDLPGLITNSEERLEQLGSKRGRALVDQKELADAQANYDRLVTASKGVAANRPGIEFPELKAAKERLNRAYNKALDTAPDLVEQEVAGAAAKAGGKVVPPAEKAGRSGRAGRAAKPAKPVYGDIDPSDDPDARRARISLDLAKGVEIATRNDTERARELDEVFKQLEVNPQVKQQLADIGAETERSHEIAVNFNGELAHGLADAIVSGKSLGDVLVNTFKRAAAALLESQIFKLLGGATGGGGAGGFFASLLGGGFADGGVPPAGKISLVGERGPELIVGNGSARVVPFAPPPAGSFGSGAGAAAQPQRVQVDVGIDVTPSPLFLTATRAVADQAASNAASRQYDKRSRRPIPRSRSV